MKLSAISLYQPTWLNAKNLRVPGRDEDAITMAVAALRPLLGPGRVVNDIVLITRSPSLIEGDTAVVIAHASGLDHARVQVVLGGAPAVVESLFSASPNTAVLAVELGERAGAGALFVGTQGASVTPSGSFSTSLPLRVRLPGEAGAHVYDDPRLLREMAWRPALEALIGEGPIIVVGVPSQLLKSVHCDPSPSEKVEAGGPAAVPFALAQLVELSAGRLIAVEQASAEALDFSGTCTVMRSIRDGVSLPPSLTDGDTNIPISLAAYARAFEAKVGFLAGKCGQCGTLSYPPRFHCLGCGLEAHPPLTALSRDASVYTVVTIRIPVPGLVSPYSLAIVELADADIRVLAQVTGVPAGTTAIGEEGELVFRKIADRQGIPDYGYAFEPKEKRSLEGVT